MSNSALNNNTQRSPERRALSDWGMGIGVDRGLESHTSWATSPSPSPSPSTPIITPDVDHRHHDNHRRRIDNLPAASLTPFPTSSATSLLSSDSMRARGNSITLTGGNESSNSFAFDLTGTESWSDPMEELLQSASTIASVRTSGIGRTSSSGLVRLSATSRTSSSGGAKSNIPPPPMSGSPTSPSQSPINATLSSRLHDEARITNWRSVLSLCRTSPELARFSGPDRWTALHHACNRRPPADVVEALLHAYPDALISQDQKGWTPLHHACRFKASLGVVRLLLHMYPSRGKVAAARRGNRGRTPLYYAIRYDAPEGVMEMLLEAESAAVWEEDRAGESPLTLVWDNYAVSNAGKKDIQTFIQSGQMSKTLFSKWEKVVMLLKSAFDGQWRVLHAVTACKCHYTLFQIAKYLHPDEMKEIDQVTGRTALHWIGRSSATGEFSQAIIKDLLAAFPEACEIKDHEGKLPLHLATEYKNFWALDGVRDIYEAFPKAIQFLDAQGRTPLHLALSHVIQNDVPVEHSKDNSIVINLVHHYPEAAQVTDQNGYLPLHVIAKNAELPDQNVKTTFNAYPKAVELRITKKGPEKACLPLHLAATNVDCKPKLLQFFLHHHPRSVTIPDDHGRLPLHLACDAGKQWDNGTHALYQAFPRAMQLTCYDKKWTPLHYAVNTPNANASLIDSLLKHDGAVHLPDRNGAYPLHLACRSGISWDQGLKRLFDAFPEAASMEDSSSMLPLHHAMLHGAKDGKHLGAQEEEGNDNDNDGGGDAENDDDIAKVDAMFHLLVIDPTVVSHL